MSTGRSWFVGGPEVLGAFREIARHVRDLALDRIALAGVRLALHSGCPGVDRSKVLLGGYLYLIRTRCWTQSKELLKERRGVGRNSSRSLALKFASSSASRPSAPQDARSHATPLVLPANHFDIFGRPMSSWMYDSFNRESCVITGKGLKTAIPSQFGLIQPFLRRCC